MQVQKPSKMKNDKNIHKVSKVGVELKIRPKKKTDEIVENLVFKEKPEIKFETLNAVQQMEERYKPTMPFIKEA